jgi:predicted Zn-dependent protease
MRTSALIALIAASGAVSVVMTRREVRARESLVPVLRVGQEHIRQLERAGARLSPLGAEEERAAGAKAMAYLEARGAAPDPWVEDLGRRLERSTLVRRYAGRHIYRVVPSSGRFAHSLPGGYVVISEGLIRALERDPGRVSFVLGHELAHAELGHVANKVRYREGLRRWGIPLGGPMQLVRNLMALSFSETEEMEADALAAKMISQADLRPAAALEVMDVLHEGRTEARPRTGDPVGVAAEALGDWWATHPGGPERRAALERAIRTSAYR